MISNCIIWAIIQIESAGNPAAVSPQNARGLMQLTDIGVKEVIAQYNVPEPEDIFDPETNVRYGTLLYKHYYRVAEGNHYLALSLYNGGYRAYYAALEGHQMPKETEDYVPKVIDAYNYCVTLKENFNDA